MPTTKSPAKINAANEGGKEENDDAKNAHTPPSPENETNTSPSPSSWRLVTGNFPYNLQLFRCLFYIVMAHNWNSIRHIPCNEWESAFAYYHTRPLGDAFCPRDQYQVDLLRYGGAAACILATFFDPATIGFAVVQNVYVFSYITRFVNHDYLFGLLGLLMVFLVYSRAWGDGEKQLAWTQCLRGQIVVVYFYAALWKMMAPTWMDGTICRGIFTTFEQQGVASGVPWSLLERKVPHLFRFLALSGLFLDGLLAVVLLSFPVGHWMQQVGVLFHGFTALTMAQRIGYGFPATMLAAGLLFRPVEGEAATEEVTATEENEPEVDEKKAKEQPKPVGGGASTEEVKEKEEEETEAQKKPEEQPETVEGEVATEKVRASEQSGAVKNTSKEAPQRHASHASWMLRNWNRHPLVTAWLLVQWMLPARMPIVSNGRYKYTGEGYRFSWTMMLHSHATFKDSVNLFTLRVYCGNDIFPSPIMPENPDVRGFPIHLQIGKRGMAALSMFPRQLPAIGAKVAEEFGKQPLCPHPEGVAVFGSMFLSTDSGPFHRTVDPERNLVRVHEALVGRNAIDTVMGTVLDKAPVEHEFILKDIGSFWDARDLPGSTDEHHWIYVVDRLPCLAADPIAVFGRAIEFVVVESPQPLWLELCRDLEQKECVSAEIPVQLEPRQTPPVAVVKFQTSGSPKSPVDGVGLSVKEGDHSCGSTSTKEDILIKFRFGPSWAPQQGQ